MRACCWFAPAVPPMFLSTSPQVDIVINSTDAVTLNCFIQGYPLMLLRWMKDGTPLDPDSSHINIATFRRQDPTDTYPFSSSMDSSFQPIPVEGLEYFEAVSELTLVPPLLRSDTANYTCEVGAVFVQNYSQTSDNIPIFILGESLYFRQWWASCLNLTLASCLKLVLPPIASCPHAIGGRK